MASLAINLNQWRENLAHRLPSGVRGIFEGGSKRELLKQVDVTLMLFDEVVLNLDSGQVAQLSGDSASDAEALASICQQLIPSDQGEASVMLLLPPGEFVATSVAMPGMTRESLNAALMLQVDSLLPSFGEKLTLAINPLDSESAHSDIALWICESRLDSLFTAFAAKNMFLASILPRTLALANEAGDLDVLESDSNTQTYVNLHQGAITRWLHVDKSDLDQEIFLKQWQQTVASNQSEQTLEINAQNIGQVYGNSARGPTAAEEYNFFPAGALLAKRQLEKGKQVILGAGIVAIIAFVCALPFLAQTFEMRSLEADLQSQRELSQTARADRLVVQDFEDEWGVINDFPEQDVLEAMFTLQSVLNPEQLTSMELSEGIIQIEGQSVEPQGILQRLEQHPMFTEVAFSRATNNSRYYINLRLSTVNFEGYMVRYFPDN
jgi:type II secretory pathway component PulL